MEPTRIYVRAVKNILHHYPVKKRVVRGMAHITGGGIVENVPRVLPRGCRAVFYRERWKVPPLMREIQRLGRVPEAEMWTTFNMGLGMVVVIRPNSLPLAQELLPEARLVGEIKAGKAEVEIR